MDGRGERLDAAAEDLWGTCDGGHLRDGQALVLEMALRPTGGEEFKASLRQALGEIAQARLVADTQQRSAHTHDLASRCQSPFRATATSHLTGATE